MQQQQLFFNRYSRLHTSMNDDRFLELIIKYKMTKDEGRAMRLSILFVRLAGQYFPYYKQYRLPKGDPRKSVLFRYCYKLVQECGDKVASNEWRYYIRAQFDVLKNIEISSDGGRALVEPNCLCGENAWRRWLVWKRKLSQKDMVISSDKPVVLARPDEVIKALDETKSFLEKKLKILNRENIINALKERAIIRWAALGEISPYYLLLSPLVKEYVREKKSDIVKLFLIETKLYESSITSEATEYFRKHFSYENKC